MSGILLRSFNFINILQLQNIFYFLMSLILLSKIGLPPLFIWFIRICVFSKLNTLFVISTIQKIIPLYIYSRLNFTVWKIWFFLTTFIIFKNLYNLVFLKKILAYSSIFNLLWMLLVNNNWFLLSNYILWYSYILIMFLYLFI